MESLKSHRTIRKYKTTVVAEDILTDILESGIRSSNTGNMQLYSIIVTKDADKKAELAPFHFNQPMVQEAPLILTICFDVNRFKSWCLLNNANVDFTGLLWLLNGTIDSSILAQNICVAAESYGLGICYLGTTLYNTPEIGKVLRLPEGVIPITTLTIGYPELVPEFTDRLSLDSVVHYEEYQNYSVKDIREMYEFKEKLESSQKFVAENGKENLAQGYTDVRYKSVDSQFFSKKLLNMLAEQGFVFE